MQRAGKNRSMIACRSVVIRIPYHSIGDQTV
jgi:hypothetical protein